MMKFTVAILLNSVVFLFVYIRLPELIELLCVNSLHRIMLVMILLPSLSLFVFPPPLLSGTVKRAGLILMVLYSLKHELDESLRDKPNIYPFPRDLRLSVSIVVDADSDMGFSINRYL